MKHEYIDKQLQAAVDGACDKLAQSSRVYLNALDLDNTTESWPEEAPARLDLIKVALAALPEPEPPTVDGKTPEDVMQSVYYSTPADKYPFRKAASAVLAAFGKQSQAAEEANARAEKAEAELARIIEAAHEAGWNGVENPKDLAQFIKYLAEEVGNRQAALLAACTSVDEQEVLSLSQLRPLAEAGEVPEGCVRYYTYKKDGEWTTATKHRAMQDTHYIDTRLPESAENATPETFEAHGKTWTKHKPGDAMPCDGSSAVMALLGDGTFCTQQAEDWNWNNRDSTFDIVGWRYADEPTPEPLATKPISLPLAEGMTLRDIFAGQALTMLADPDFSASPEDTAKLVYRIADAMLKAREVKP